MSGITEKKVCFCNLYTYVHIYVYVCINEYICLFLYNVIIICVQISNLVPPPSSMYLSKMFLSAHMNINIFYGYAV